MCTVQAAAAQAVTIAAVMCKQHKLGTTGLCSCADMQILRLSLVDPWMHDKNDGFPLLYIRSHAARLPGR
jgi:hypothetical protein